MDFIKNAHYKKTTTKIICLISGIALSIVGLYFFHMQYLCYEYTPLLFIVAVAVCLGGTLLSLPLNKKKVVKNAVVTASVFAAILIGLMLIINAIIGNGELHQIALIVPVYLSFIAVTILVLLCIIKIFDKKILKAILCVIVLTGFAIGSYSYIVPFAVDEIYKDYKAPAPILSTYTKTEDDKMISGDFYVSTNGDDSNNGTKDEPFLTVEKALEAVRNTDKTNKKGITVCIYPTV